MMFIVATNVVASQPPERRPTRTPHAHAKSAKMHFTVFFTLSKAKRNNLKDVFRLNTTVTTFLTIFYQKRDFPHLKQLC